MASSQGFSSGLYFRLMIISSADILATIPLGMYILVSNVKLGVGPWRSWASTHRHYSVINQIPGSIWKNNRQIAQNLDMFRWLLVGCAFIFFAFFGFAEEARQNYRRVYTSLASRIGYRKSTLRGSSHACVAYLLVYSSAQTYSLPLFLAVLRQFLPWTLEEMVASMSLWPQHVGRGINRVFHSPTNLRSTPPLSPVTVSRISKLNLSKIHL